MQPVPGGAFALGSANFYPEEAPVRWVDVEGFWIGERRITVSQFRRFVKQMGYASVAERPLAPAQFPDADRADAPCPGQWSQRELRLGCTPPAR
jgi:sulfatase modifying factor 1